MSRRSQTTPRTLEIILVAPFTPHLRYDRLRQAHQVVPDAAEVASLTDTLRQQIGPTDDQSPEDSEARWRTAPHQSYDTYLLLSAGADAHVKFDGVYGGPGTAAIILDCLREQPIRPLQGNWITSHMMSSPAMLLQALLAGTRRDNEHRFIIVTAPTTIAQFLAEAWKPTKSWIKDTAGVIPQDEDTIALVPGQAFRFLLQRFQDGSHSLKLTVPDDEATTEAD